jgi:hypothetical protein
MRESAAEKPVIQDIFASASVPNTEKSQHSNSGCNSGENASPQFAPTISLVIAQEDQRCSRQHHNRGGDWIHRDQAEPKAL